MNDLITNGIDHSQFDLEWAKRGGVIRLTDYVDLSDIVNRIERIAIMQKSIGKVIAATDTTLTIFTVPPLRPMYVSIVDVIGMATPMECAIAGVEYIEPPMAWRDIESAPKNTWVIATDGFYVTEAFFTTSRNAWVMKGGGELSVTHWMPKPQPPKDE